MFVCYGVEQFNSVWSLWTILEDFTVQVEVISTDYITLIYSFYSFSSYKQLINA